MSTQEFTDTLEMLVNLKAPSGNYLFSVTEARHIAQQSPDKIKAIVDLANALDAQENEA